MGKSGRNAEVKEVPEVQGKPFMPIDPPAGVAPATEAGQNDGGGQEERPEVLQILARARAKLRKAKPTMEEGQVPIEIWNYLDGDEQQTVMDAITEASFHAEEISRDIPAAKSQDSNPPEAYSHTSWGIAMRQVQKAMRPYHERFKVKVLQAAEEEARAKVTAADELIGMGAEVRRIIAALPLKARAAFETVLQVYQTEGLSLDVDWGGDLVKELCDQHEAIDQARRELVDDPDINVLERASRLASIVEGDLPSTVDVSAEQRVPAAPATESAEKNQPASDEAPDTEGPAPESKERLQLSKASGELIPLVRFLKGCTFREKLAAVAMDTLTNGDVEAQLGPRRWSVYEGQIGDDLGKDWTEDVFDAIAEEEIGTPEERVLAAYLAGLSAAR